MQAELDQLLRETLVRRWRSQITEEQYHQVLKELVERRVTPWQAVTALTEGER